MTHPLKRHVQSVNATWHWRAVYEPLENARRLALYRRARAAMENAR